MNIKLLALDPLVIRWWEEQIFQWCALVLSGDAEHEHFHKYYDNLLLN